MEIGRKTNLSISGLLSNAYNGFPALLGVIIGVLIYLEFSWTWVILLVSVLLVAVVFLWIGRVVLAKRPVFGQVLIEFWVLSSLPMSALGAILVTWLTVNTGGILFSSGTETEQKELSKAFAGAVATFLATLITKDIAEASGFLSAAGQFKSAVKKAFADITDADDTRAFQAVYGEQVQGGIEGWGLSARRERAKILQSHVQGNPNALR